MAWHDRNVLASQKTPGVGDVGLRMKVMFQRQDLLYVSQEADGMAYNPYTNKRVPIPLVLPNGALVAPNIFDIMKKEVIPKPPRAADNEPDMYRLVIRPVKECFKDPTKDKKAKSEQDKRLSPFSKALSTIGRRIDVRGDFIQVEKRSSISISKLVFLLAEGMYGGIEEATSKIRCIAEEAWDRDLKRAEKLYKRIKLNDSVPVEELDGDVLEAVSTISQEVEQFLLAEACRWLGVDPDRVVERKRGRPPGKTDENSDSGKVLKMTLLEDESIEGVFIVDFGGHRKGINLKEFDIKGLAELLVALQDAEHVKDVELLETYLEILDPDWRDTILSGAGDSIPEGAILGHDPYAILGIDQTATIEELKKAYRRAIRQVHPDHTGLPDYFAQLVNNAYRTLLERMKNAR